MSGYVFKPFAGSSHAWALAEVAALPPGPLKVLDVGAAEGQVHRAVRERRREPVEVWAVEPRATGADPAGARWVRDLAEVEPDDFDLALLLDVLEHTADPDAFLAAVVARVRPGGALLLSVPNVAHWSVRLQLLAGRFDYAERGILDRTHLRFFTARSLAAVVGGAGLTVEATAAAVVPLELLLPQGVVRAPAWRLLTAARRGLARAWPGLLAYQLLVKARAPGRSARPGGR